MEREELLRQCRYYKGERKSPYGRWQQSWYWDMERVWVASGGRFEGEGQYYVAHGFDTFEGQVPFSLLVTMFTSWGKTEYDIPAAIGSFYSIVREYLGE